MKTTCKQRTLEHLKRAQRSLAPDKFCTFCLTQNLNSLVRDLTILVEEERKEPATATFVSKRRVLKK